MTGYRVLGIVYLDQLSGARHTHISNHNNLINILHFWYRMLHDKKVVCGFEDFRFCSFWFSQEQFEKLKKFEFNWELILHNYSILKWERIIIHIRQNACSNIGALMYECNLQTSEEWFINRSNHTSERSILMYVPYLQCMNG